LWRDNDNKRDGREMVMKKKGGGEVVMIVMK
jgi:hypothetical protein